MRKLLNNRWFVAALALAALALVWSSLQPATAAHSGSVEPATEEIDLATVDAPLSADEPQQMSMREVLLRLALKNNVRDPFALRSVTESTATEKLAAPDQIDNAHLSALWTQNDATLVLINDRIHVVGDSIGRFTIESASPQGVWLAHWKGRTFLEVGKSFVLKTPARLPVQVSSP